MEDTRLHKKPHGAILWILLSISYNIQNQNSIGKITNHLLKSPRSCYADEIVGLNDILGKLSRYKILHWRRRAVTAENLEQILSIFGTNDKNDDLNQFAWGAEMKSTLIEGVIPYRDAERISRKVDFEVVKVNYPIFI